MSSCRHKSQLAGALFVITVLAALPQPASAAKSCKSWAFIGQATAASKNQAAAQAITDWSQKVTDYWGFQWANWSIAETKWEQCERSGRGFRCLAHGRPCMPGLKWKSQ